MDIRRRGLHMRWLVLPVLAGALVMVAAVVVPAHPVAGSVAAGPVYPTFPAPPWKPGQVAVSWTPTHRAVVLHVRWGAGCRPELLHVTSTAPARVEVLLGLDFAPACEAHRMLYRFLLRPPIVAEPGQAANVFVDGQPFTLPRYRR